MNNDHSTVTTNFQCNKQYQQYAASLNMPEQAIDGLIDVIHAILSYFVDKAFNIQTDQITLQSASKSFNAPFGRDTVKNQFENQTANVPSNDVEGDLNPTGPSEP